MSRSGKNVPEKKDLLLKNDLFRPRVDTGRSGTEGGRTASAPAVSVSNDVREDCASDVVQGCSPAAGGRQTGARLVDDGVVYALSGQVQFG